MITTVFLYAGVIIVSYLAGSIPFGYLIGKMVRGIDIRTQGSGNIGATNVTRVVGKGWGKLCFLLDFLKGFLPVFAAMSMIQFAKLEIPGNDLIGVAGAFFAVAGHMFPVFLHFHGGKGISTAAGAILALNPLAVLLAGIVWVIVFFLWRYVSLASICAAIVLPCAAYLLTFLKIHCSIPVLVLLALLAVIAVIKHIPNIKRLLNGTESRFGKKTEERQ